jgi:hypothetical protein
MDLPTYPSPEEAAMIGFPGQAVRVLATARDGDDAYVLLDTGPAGEPYLYGVCVNRERGGWVEGTSGNGSGWTLTGGEDDVGTLTEWGEAPEGATRVRVVFGGEVREAPVANGVYLLAWWRVPCPTDDFPRVDAFQIDGRWVAER